MVRIRCRRRIPWYLPMLAALAVFGVGLPVGFAYAETQGFQSGHGITVHAQRQLNDRLVEVDIASDAVNPGATHEGNRVRVLLPAGYAPPTRTRATPCSTCCTAAPGAASPTGPHAAATPSGSPPAAPSSQ